MATFANSMELTNNIRKTIASLDDTKYRRALGMFKVEGTKSVVETIGRFELVYLVATDEWLNEHRGYDKIAIKASSRDIGRMSSFVTSPGVLAIYKIPQRDDSIRFDDDRLVLVLDSIRDPGNLGTIIRIADWFGINDIFCSNDTTDCYNPKVVQATMGSIARVRLHYVDIVDLLKNYDSAPIYGTFLNGDNIYRSKLTKGGIIVIGNESRGISTGVSSLVNRRLTIPSFPPGESTGESLNAAIATAIVVSAFREKQWQNN